MIIGMGIDLVDLRVLDPLAKGMLDRFTENEIALAEGRDRYIHTLGKRLAVKEAVIKALGVNDTLGGVRMRDIETRLTPSGRPMVLLAGGALNQLLDITPPGYISRVEISITDDGVMAAAVALIHATPMP